MPRRAGLGAAVQSEELEQRGLLHLESFLVQFQDVQTLARMTLRCRSFYAQPRLTLV